MVIIEINWEFGTPSSFQQFCFEYSTPIKYTFKTIFFATSDVISKYWFLWNIAIHIWVDLRTWACQVQNIFSLFSCRLWKDIKEDEYKMLQSTLCADIVETDSQVSFQSFLLLPVPSPFPITTYRELFVLGLGGNYGCCRHASFEDIIIKRL